MPSIDLNVPGNEGPPKTTSPKLAEKEAVGENDWKVV
jgi:hypothetical protein